MASGITEVLFSGLQTEAYGRNATIRCRRLGDPPANWQSSHAMGGESGETPLRAVSTALLHGESAERRTSQPQSESVGAFVLLAFKIWLFYAVDVS